MLQTNLGFKKTFSESNYHNFKRITYIHRFQTRKVSFRKQLNMINNKVQLERFCSEEKTLNLAI